MYMDTITKIVIDAISMMDEDLEAFMESEEKVAEDLIGSFKSVIETGDHYQPSLVLMADDWSAGNNKFFKRVPYAHIKVRPPAENEDPIRAISEAFSAIPHLGPSRCIFIIDDYVYPAEDEEQNDDNAVEAFIIFGFTKQNAIAMVFAYHRTEDGTAEFMSNIADSSRNYVIDNSIVASAGGYIKLRNKVEFERYYLDFLQTRGHGVYLSNEYEKYANVELPV